MNINPHERNTTNPPAGAPEETPGHPGTMVDFPISDLFPASPECATTSFEQTADQPASEPPNLPDQATKLVRLRVLNGKSRGLFLTLRERKFTIGRDPGCHLRPQSQWISWVHACVEQRDGKVFVCDLGSTNGTIVNHRTLRGEEVEVNDGDRLEVGPLHFLFAISHGSVENVPPCPPVPERSRPESDASHSADVPSNPLSDLQFTVAIQPGPEIRLVSDAVPPPTLALFEQLLQGFLAANGRIGPIPSATIAPLPAIPAPVAAPEVRVAPIAIPMAASAPPISVPTEVVSSLSPSDCDVLLNALLKEFPDRDVPAPLPKRDEPEADETRFSDLLEAAIKDLPEDYIIAPAPEIDETPVEAPPPPPTTPEPKAHPVAQSPKEYMNLDFQCPECGTPGTVPLSRLGRQFVCKACNAKFFIETTGTIVVGERTKTPKKADPVLPMPRKAIKTASKKAPTRGSIDLLEGLFNGWQDIPQSTKVGSLAACLIFVFASWFVATRLLGDPLQARSARVIEAVIQPDEDRLKALSAPKTSEDTIRWMRLISPIVKRQFEKGVETRVSVASHDPKSGRATIMVYFKANPRAARPAASSGRSSQASPTTALAIEPAMQARSSSAKLNFMVLLWVKDRQGNWLLEGSKTLRDASTRLTPSPSIPFQQSARYAGSITLAAR